MDISISQLINHLPDGSTLKTLLASLGTDAENVDATVELYEFVEAFSQAKKEHNQLPHVQRLNVVSDETLFDIVWQRDGSVTRRLERKLSFFQRFENSGISSREQI
ncbi:MULTISPECIES: hypothetical protein [Oscillatoriales]|jgi:hypothetical protein|uniref:Uncharacterized protein n=2 Tax=Limnospira TaxID=2596745 RepID=A0A5M3TDG7_LIMPL|nr:hypothetical protein [Arthrospira platensis]AMW28893.1 hypothetical protein AP285_13920 [Arthrospira platensis YZ]KDR56013.1 hypothetical protein APPUASWS_019340 [Arthrospira platensis str. Paraca]MDF2212646.1 hypothetical protein [Arthrospira platensis NCB002]QQW31653.1 hypothetical protein AP9108_15060 [Arthrospira sp. PCC 9108]BAI90970.1 hypothetical protein NIES39_H00450 [Arthrospira platensis NIES-39]